MGVKIRKPKKVTEQDIAQGLIRAAANGKLETCPLCKAQVISVALHYLTCPAVKA
jgi:hypothetical protein